MEQALVSTPRFVIIGNLANRRVTMFQAELAERSMLPAIEIAYADLIANPTVFDGLPDEPLLIRQDSAGEDDAVTRGLMEWGYEEAHALGLSCMTPSALRAGPLPHGILTAPRQLHFGFLRALSLIEAAAAKRPNWRLLSPPASIATLFDKRETSKQWQALEVPTPLCLDDVHDYDDMRARVVDKGWRSVYVKISCSSSASGLAIFTPGEPDRILTTLEHTPEAYYNSLKLRRYSDSRRVREIIGFFLEQGAQVECATPKARMGRAFFDLRIVAIAGEPVFAVVRKSPHPITNLHLGGERGDWKQFRDKIDDESWAAIDESCRQVAAQARCHCIGIDVLVEPDWKTHRILEANAFGDLLPRLRRRGKSVYGWQIDALAGEQ